MGNVIVVFRIMPDGVDSDIAKIRDALVLLKAQKVEEEPLAFGLKVLKAYFVVPDAEGGTEALEQAVKNIEGVSEAEVIEMNRTLF